MFKFLKDKLKNALSKFSRDVDEKAETSEEEIEVKKPAKAVKKPVEKEGKKPSKQDKREGTKKKERVKKEEKIEEEEPEQKEGKKTNKSSKKERVKDTSKERTKYHEETEEENKPEKKGFFGRLKEKLMGKEAPESEGEAEEDNGTEENIEEEKSEKEKIEEEVPETEESEEESEDETEKESEAEEKEGEENEEEPEEESEEEEPEKKGFFQRFKEIITTKTISDSQFEELFWELEVVLLENNVAVEVISKIKEDLRKEMVNIRLQRGKIEETVALSLKNSISSLFDVPKVDIIRSSDRKKPFIIVFIGINGSGKTTSIAKVAHYLLKNKKSCVMAAGDTFRAAAIQQLEEHGNRLGVKVIKHDYGSDPAAVAFDAIKYAEAHNISAVLVDTAGRQHSNTNLMDEMKKIIRVAKPDLKIFVGESITGNDCIEQAKEFDNAVEIDGIILTKADVDEKGGAAVSVSYV
ncbi:MAG TPA: signal recognition particle-docking protein FtsY, partial [Candidatus Nanoarchaeia archaeon]|nr:signal recognition particle-docking protein FtsY [Candidatus Nanoarchaeia archaeon]